jgi:hypothetical protein
MALGASSCELARVGLKKAPRGEATARGKARYLVVRSRAKETLFN